MADDTRPAEPRSTLRAGYLAVLVRGKSMRHQAEADLHKLVDEGRGDVPLVHLPFRCRCGFRSTGISAGLPGHFLLGFPYGWPLAQHEP